MDFPKANIKMSDMLLVYSFSISDIFNATPIYALAD